MKNALVTGGSSGIGRAVVMRLARSGYNVTTCARNQKDLINLTEKLGKEGKTISTYEVDLRHELEIKSLFRDVEKTSGPLDVLINNAGVGHDAPLSSGATELWRDMIDVNILAVCICTREALQHMYKHNNTGHIVNICSLSGHRLGPEGGLYAATKFALTAITESLRRELVRDRTKIRVTQISPGLVETQFHSRYHRDSAVSAEIYNRFPPLDAENIAEAVHYALLQPTNVNVSDILIRPLEQDF
jgi:NADP-dependent 3-hydroxy acid dehydrogenase YdfG